MDAGTWFTQLNAWQVMALGLVFFGAIYVLGALAYACSLKPYIRLMNAKKIA